MVKYKGANEMMGIVNRSTSHGPDFLVRCHKIGNVEDAERVTVHHQKIRRLDVLPGIENRTRRAQRLGFLGENRLCFSEPIIATPIAFHDIVPIS